MVQIRFTFGFHANQLMRGIIMVSLEANHGTKNYVRFCHKL